MVEGMKRATITLSDELEAEVEEYLAAQPAPPSLTSLVQAALRSFLTERHGSRGRSGGAPAPSEVAEESAVYGAAVRSDPSGPWTWGAPATPHLRDLPGLLAGLPRLSQAEAGELADDLDRARKGLERGELHDPWSSPDEVAPETGRK